VASPGAFYSGWTGAEPFGTIFIYRYYGYQVNCSACIKTRQHFFQRFEDAVFDLELLMTKAFEIGELPFCRPQGLTARQIAGSARRASVRSLSACRVDQAGMFRQALARAMIDAELDHKRCRIRSASSQMLFVAASQHDLRVRQLQTSC